MRHSKIPLAQTLVNLCKKYKLQHIVISPGSRNAPLIISFTNDPFFKCHSVVDERCAAFYALGIAQQTRLPAVLVCTSGSALLNYYPAIAEAYYSNIPLIVLSADRPKHLLNIGDGQTINQAKVFDKHVIYDASLKSDIDPKGDVVDDNELPIFKNLENKLERFLGIQQEIQEYNEIEINKAINKAINKSGPVHLNVPFSEPLYDKTDSQSVQPQILKFKEETKSPKDYAIDEMAKDWNIADKKIILIGALDPNSIQQEFIDLLTNDGSVIIFTETTSNLHHESIFQSIDKIIAPLNQLEFENLQPEILMTFGGMVVSKKIKAFLRNFQPKAHWHIGLHRANDTFFKLKKHINLDPNTFLDSFLLKIEGKTNNYKEDWELVKEHRQKRHSEYLSRIEFSDLKAYEYLLNSLPDNSIVQFGNSAAIRYSQLFNLNPTVEVFCNRGTSGIEGSTSTAIGCATVREKQTILITGDLSFFYDSNALWNDSIPSSFRIIIVNNNGGGIFRILPGDKETMMFEKFFETNHNLNAEHLSKMFNFEYFSCSNTDSLKIHLDEFYKVSSNPKILEVFTPRLNNGRILLDYFNYLR